MTSEQRQRLVCNCLEVNTLQADGEQEKMKRGGWQLRSEVEEEVVVVMVNLGEMVMERESPEPWALGSSEFGTLGGLGAWGLGRRDPN